MKSVGGDGGWYSERVWVKVLYFGVLRDLFGVADEAAEVPDGATVGELLGLLRGLASNNAMGKGAEPGKEEQLWRSLAVAVNREYGSASNVLREGDEVALLPPVSGGRWVG
jgi:molybdopterin converting factor subunit 1